MATELHLFAHASTWKAYWTSFVRDYVIGDVLEVGAGIGINTKLLRSPRQARWVCLEPDRVLLPNLEASIETTGPSDPCEIVTGTTEVSISSGTSPNSSALKHHLQSARRSSNTLQPTATSRSRNTFCTTESTGTSNRSKETREREGRGSESIPSLAVPLGSSRENPAAIAALDTLRASRENSCRLH